jgi:hypothetical protein
MDVQVVRFLDDGSTWRGGPKGSSLTMRVWRFWYDPRCHELILDSFTEETRASTRHKFVETTRYDRIRKVYGTGLADTSVPFPADVVKEARESFSTSLRVARSSDAKGW